MMPRRLRFIGVLIVVAMIGCSAKYNKILVEKIRAALGPDFRDYKSFSYPTNNFGLATAYDRVPNDQSFICDTWECLGKGNQVPDAATALLEVDGFAAVGDNGALITLSETEKTDLSLKVLLPQMFQAVGLAGDVSNKQIVTTSLDLGRAYPRKLRRTRMSEYINSLPTAHPVKQAFNGGNLALVVADVIVDKVRATIKVDATTQAGIEAKLDPGLPSKVFSGASLNLRVSREVAGTYTFEITRPVVLMRLTKRQAAAGVLGAADDDWLDWQQVEDALPKSPRIP